MRTRKKIAILLGFVAVVLLASPMISPLRLARLAFAQEGGAPAGRQAPASQLTPARDLAMKITAPFTFSGVGDIILRHPVAQLADPNFQGLIKNLRDADVAFANMEGTIIDYSNLPDEGIRGGMPKEGISDLKAMGIKIMNHANNHTMDTGVTGMLQTNDMLLAAGIAQAGTGKNLEEARAPVFISTPKGRIALVGMFSQDPTSTPAPASTDAATYRNGDDGGVPGVNALRVSESIMVTADQFDALKKIRDSVYARRNEGAYAYPMADIPSQRTQGYPPGVRSNVQDWPEARRYQLDDECPG